MIRGVTFDFWDTIVGDETDEPKRSAAGLASKKIARVQTFVDEVRVHHPGLPVSEVEAALAEANARFRHHWKVEHHTPCVSDRLAVGFDVLGIERTPGFDGLVAAWETMEVQIPPDLVPGIGDCLAELHKTMAVGIISDAIVTPGTGLRQILGDYGLLQHFDHSVFSDEAGAAKPAARVFDLACEGLGIRPAELLHIGDREANDIAGPVAYGAHCVLYTGAVDRRVPGEQTRASSVVAHMSQMPAAIAQINARILGA
jgi:HAD superfamily hydrolase (TIGR01549 family)